MKLIWPYILTIVVFIGLFIVTMTIDNRFLYLGYGQNGVVVLTNNKVPQQAMIFVVGLVVVLTLINVAERVLTDKPRIVIRALKTIATVSTIYYLNYQVFQFLEIDTYCVYLNHTGTPAIPFFIATLWFLAIILGFFEFTTRTRVYPNNRRFILKFIPGFIKRSFHENGIGMEK